MHCKTCRNRILLAMSGESPDAAQRLVNVHIKQCTACRAFAQEINHATVAARKHLPTGTPHPFALVAIQAAASEPPQSGWFPVHMHGFGLAATAAAVLIAGGIWFATSIWQPPSQHARVANLSAMVTVAGDTLADAETDYIVVEDEHNLKAVAQQILELEGFTVDELFGEDHDATLPEAPDPITIQWHKTPASPARICV